MTHKILVIDDSELAREMTESMLVELGYETESAENGMEALEMAIATHYDCILVDLNMPVMDGYTFIEKIRKTEGYDDVPVVIVTTESESRDRERGYEVGADVYIVKPLKSQVISEHLHMLLGG